MAKRLMNRVKESLLQVPGLDEGPSVFAQDDAVSGFFVDGTQIAHFVDAGLLALRLTRRQIRALRTRLEVDPRIMLRANASEWLTVSFSAGKDLPFVVELAELAVAAHRPPPGVVSKPPPFGAELARRRRFH